MKSTQSFGANKMKAGGEPTAKSFEGKPTQILISSMRAFDSLMRFIVDPRFCESRTDQALNEFAIFAILTIGPVLLLGWNPLFLLGLPVLWFINALRHIVIGATQRPAHHRLPEP